jgi:FecR protein
MGKVRASRGRHSLISRFLNLRLIILLVLGCVHAGCETLPPIVPSREPSSITLEQPRGSVSVIRQGRWIAVGLPMPLEIGDEVETSGDSSATIRYPEGHEVRLMPETRVRLDSIFVLFGEIRAFVRGVRGFFRVESDFVSLDVEGTEFWFRVERDQTVGMGVFAGSVRLSSKTGRWRSIRVTRGEVYTIPRDGLPREDTRGTVPTPPPPDRGWCCLDGRVSRDRATDCRRQGGQFYDSEEQARRYCKEPLGWCCVEANLSREDAADCQRKRGRFYDAEDQARRYCEPVGWCCVDGKVSREDATDCRRRRGQYFRSETEAYRFCEPMGWCCGRDGRIIRATEAECRRKADDFYASEREAARHCQRQGWCCNRNGRVFETTEAQCRREGGSLYDTRRAAERDRKCWIR